MTTGEVPSQLSVVSRFTGYGAWLRLRAAGFHVFCLLDGVRLARCVAADRDAGTATVYAPREELMAATRRGDELPVRVLHGVVSYELTLRTDSRGPVDG